MIGSLGCGSSLYRGRVEVNNEAILRATGDDWARQNIITIWLEEKKCTCVEMNRKLIFSINLVVFEKGRR